MASQCLLCLGVCSPNHPIVSSKSPLGYDTKRRKHLQVFLSPSDDDARRVSEPEKKLVHFLKLVLFGFNSRN